MAAPKSTSRTLYIDTLAAQQALEKLTKAEADLNKKIAEGQAAGKKMTAELQKLDTVKNSIANVQKQIDSGLKPSLTQLESLARKTKNELAKLSENDPRFNEKLKLYQDLSGRIANIRGQLGGAQQAQEGWLSSITKSSAGMVTAGLALGALATKAIGFFSDSIDEFEQAEQRSSRLKNILDNIGRSDAFDRVTQSADLMAQRFRFLDNDDIVGVFEKIITYGKLSEKQMNELTPVIIDFSKKAGVGLDEATSTILKALEGNGKALKEYGISIKDAGTVSERFGVIMNELKPKVEGAADAYGKTLAGQADIAKQSIADLKEEIGGNLAPIKEKFYGFLAEITGGIKNFFEDLSTTDKQGNKTKVGFLTKLSALFDFSATGVAARAEIAIAKEEARKAAETALKSATTDNKPLNPNAKPDVDEEAVKKAAEAAKKAKEKSDEIIKKIREAQQELELLGLNADQKERARIIKKYEDLAEEARKYIVGEAARVKALADIYAMKDKELAFQLDRIQKEYQDKTAKTAGDAAAKIFADAKKRREDEKKEKEQDLADDIAISKLRLLQAKKGSVEELNAKLALLDSEREQALANTDKTEAEKALIREQYRQQEAQLQDEFLQTQLQKDLEQIDSALGYLSQVINLIDTFDQAKTNRENAEFNREKKANDAKRAEYKRLLDSKLISELEYKRKVRALDLEEEQKREELDRKQNERRKRTSIAQAIVNGAQAITRALADYSFPAALVPIAFAVATTAAQVAAISGQKYEKGGIARGSRHSEGGIAMVDRRTGRHVGEMEGGEPYMILSRNTYRNNGALIDQLLYSSMYRNGAPVYPAYATRTYQAVNFGAVNRSLSARKFESGGITDTRTPDMSTDPMLMALIKENSEVNRALLQEIQNGISINLSKIERAQQLQSRIYNDAAING